MGQVGGCGRAVGLRRRFRGVEPAREACGEALLPLSRASPTADVAPPTQGTFQQMWISKQEYEEGGKQCVERKCP